MKTAIPITHARRNKLQQWDRTTGKCPSERFCLSVFHKASAWQLRKGEYNCSKCISFLAIKQVSHVHLGDGKRKGSKCRQEGEIMTHRVLLLYTQFYIPSMHIYEHVWWKIAFLGTSQQHLWCISQSWLCHFAGSQEGNGGWAWQSEDGTKTRGSCHAVLTSHLVHQNAWGNNASILREELLQFLLSHSFWQATDV